MMLTIIDFHLYNDSILPMLGVLINLVVMFLIRVRTAKEMRTYSQTLMQNCTIDLLFNIVIFVTKSQAEVYDGLVIFMLGGFAARVQHPWDFLFHLIYIYFCFFTIVAMVVPFYCRYRVFCKNDSLSNYRISALYFMASLAAFSVIFIFGFAFVPIEGSYSRTIHALRSSIFIKENGEMPVFISSAMTSPLFILYFVYAFIVFILTYSLIVWFARHIYSKLMETNLNMNERKRRFHLEINRVLIAQAICPLFATVIPISWGLLCALLRIKIHGLTLIVSMTISWACVLNPLNAIIWVSIYRKALLNPGKYLFPNRVNSYNWNSSITNESRNNNINS